MVGRFSLGLAIGAPVMMLTNLQLRGVQATDARRQYRFGHYLALRLVMTTVAVAVIALIACLAGYPFETAAVVLIVGAAKASESLSDVYHGLLQQNERMARIAKSLMIKGPISLIATAWTLWATGSLVLAAGALAVAKTAVMVAYDTRSARTVAHDGFAPSWEFSRLLSLARLALPLGVVMMLISLNTNVPRYFLESGWGERELGFFSAMAYLQVAGTAVVGALGQSASPRLARFHAAGDHDAFKRLLVRLCLIGIGLGAAGVLVAALLGAPVLALLYRPDYAEHAGVLVWLMGAAGLGYVSSFFGYAMTAARRFAVQLPLFGLVVLVCSLSCALLVPAYGLYGAAWSLMLASGVSLLGSGGVVVRVLSGLRVQPLPTADVH